MRSRIMLVALWLGLVSLPALASAQSPDSLTWRADGFVRGGEDEGPVYEYNLSGPRFGVTLAPDGDARTQFGWHFEHQASPGKDGPRFIVETLLLVGGVERDQFIPNASMIFGMRLPNSFEVGVGPSVTLGWRGTRSAVVLAAGHSFRTGGIRIPMHVAVALDKDGDHRVSLVTGWAIRDRVYAR